MYADSSESRKRAAYAVSQPVPWRPSGTGVRARDGRPCEAKRPSAVSINPGATMLARTARRSPSRATWRTSPPSAAFEAS